MSSPVRITYSEAVKVLRNLARPVSPATATVEILDAAWMTWDGDFAGREALVEGIEALEAIQAGRRGSAGAVVKACTLANQMRAKLRGETY